MAVDEQTERDLKNIKLEHQQLALQALFIDGQEKFPQFYDKIIFSDEELARIGIVQRNNDSKLQFIHRTFAEYYVAELLIKQLTKKTTQNEQVQEILLNVVLLKEDCQVIRNFFDGLLKKSEPTEEALREYGKKLGGECNEKQVHAPLEVAKTALLTAAKEGNVHIVGFLIDSLKSRESLSAVKKLLLAKDHQGQTAWHKATVRCHVEVLQKLCDVAKELQLKPQEMRNEVLLSKNKYGYTAWLLAAESGQVEILEKLWNWAKELQLKPEEIRNVVLLSKNDFGNTAWQMAAESGQVEILEKLRKWANELQLRPEEIRNVVLLSKNVFGNTAWHLAAERGQVEILEKLWNWAKELQLKPEEIRNEVLLSKNKYGNTAWH
jgi:ankyrin repeat protein